MNLVFSSFVFGSYQKYIPYYIYSVWKTHPESYVKIFTDKKLEINIEETLTYLKENNIRNFEIVNFCDSFHDYNKYKMKGGGVKTLVRYLIDIEHFYEFDYVYIGDIDILFLEEDLSIPDFHIRQMKQLGLPFSNKVRVDKNGIITKRLTGLHFLKTKEYFEKINSIILKIKNDKSYREKYFEGLNRDEEFLYRLNMDAFNFSPLQLSKAERPWHGMHLGITRGNKNVDIKTVEENSSLSIEDIKKQLKEYLKDPIFQEIQKQVFLIELEVILKELSIPYSFLWKYEGLKYKIRHRFRLAKRKLKACIK